MCAVGLAVLGSLLLVGAGCGGSQSRAANDSMRPGGINRTAAAMWSLLTSSEQRSFIRSQHSWLAYRRRQCDVEFSVFSGGTEGPVAGGRCLLRITAERIKDTKATLRLYAGH